MKRRQFLGGCACCGLNALFPNLAQADTQWLIPPRLEKPEAGTDEGGLWALLDREEAKLRRSSFLVSDKALNDYINEIVKRLAGEHFGDIRLYIVKSPYFNATMAPNGMLQVWTGLLLRISNEAQLAAILGHEIGHYVSRHGVDRLRDAKSRSAFGILLAGLGIAGAIASLAMLAGMYSYTRDQESAADDFGLNLMSKAGYAPIEASTVWAQLLEEIKAEKDWSGDPGQRSVLFASHPPPEDRYSALMARASQFSGAGLIGDQRFRAAIAPYRWKLLEDELLRRKFGESLALLQRLSKESPNDPELNYFMGETYRMRGNDGDQQLALEAYRNCADQPNAPAEVYRAMGTIFQQRGDVKLANEAFKRYVTLKPSAADVEMIKTYINEKV